MGKYISFTTVNQNYKVFGNKINEKGIETMKS